LICAAVEGAGRIIHNRLSNCARIFQNIRRRDSQQTISPVAQERVPRLVVLWPVASVVRLAIDFDDEAGCAAVKIRDVRINWVLPAECDARG
jgi:hypothetical protein